MRLFGAKEGITRLEAVHQHVQSILCNETSGSIYLLLSQAIQEALSLKKILDEYNGTLLVPVSFSWIDVHPFSKDGTNELYSKPIGNCGIVICTQEPLDCRFEGFEFFQIEDGRFCLERRIFSVEKISAEFSLLTEPIILRLEFTSNEAQLQYVVPENTSFFTRFEKQIELYYDRLDCTIILHALKQGARAYTVFREAEVLVSNKNGETANRFILPEANRVPANTIEKCCLPYCDLLDEEELIAFLPKEKIV